MAVYITSHSNEVAKNFRLLNLSSSASSSLSFYGSGCASPPSLGVEGNRRRRLAGIGFLRFDQLFVRYDALFLRGKISDNTLLKPAVISTVLYVPKNSMGD